MSIKAGKGYDEHGHPRGPIGGKCSECDGDIISIKMNTSRKGFETTSEKVCNRCGLVVPGAFQTLDHNPNDYRGKYYATHEEWIQNQCMEVLNDDDIAWQNESYVHATGHRLHTSDDVGYDAWRYDKQKNDNHNNPRIAKAIWRLNKTPESMKISSSDRNMHKHMLLIDDYAHEVELLPYQTIDVKWIIKHDIHILKWPYKIEDMIYNLCLVIGNKDLRKYRQYNERLYTLLKERYLG